MSGIWYCPVDENFPLFYFFSLKSVIKKKEDKILLGPEATLPQASLLSNKWLVLPWPGYIAISVIFCSSILIKNMLAMKQSFILSRQNALIIWRLREHFSQNRTVAFIQEKRRAWCRNTSFFCFSFHLLSYDSVCTQYLDLFKLHGF